MTVTPRSAPMRSSSWADADDIGTNNTTAAIKTIRTGKAVFLNLVMVIPIFLSDFISFESLWVSVNLYVARELIRRHSESGFVAPVSGDENRWMFDVVVLVAAFH